MRFAPALLAASLCAGLAFAQEPNEGEEVLITDDLKAFERRVGTPRGEKKPDGTSDPRGVFRVVEGDQGPVLEVSGEVEGALTTIKSYRNFRLNFEYQWPKRDAEDAPSHARRAGVTLFAAGALGRHGETGLPGLFLAVAEGATGDLTLRQNAQKALSMRGRARAESGAVYFDSEAEPVDLEGGTLFWKGRDRSWEDRFGFRGSKDLERPIGQWNDVEVICVSDRVSVKLNGQVVNELARCVPEYGAIQFHSDGSRVRLRAIRVRPEEPDRGS